MLGYWADAALGTLDAEGYGSVVAWRGNNYPA